MKIHIYSVCSGEEKILPYYFMHYSPDWVEKIVLFDNESTNKSYDIALNQPHVEIRKYKSDDNFSIQFKNNILKESKGKNIDWVIIVNMNEFIYHENLTDFLDKNNEYNIIVPVNYQMTGNQMTGNQLQLCQKTPIYEQIVSGYQFSCNKSESFIFQPDKLTYINNIHHNFESKILKNNKEIKLLHYKTFNKYLDNNLNNINNSTITWSNQLNNHPIQTIQHPKGYEANIFLPTDQLIEFLKKNVCGQEKIYWHLNNGNGGDCLTTYGTHILLESLQIKYQLHTISNENKDKDIDVLMYGGGGNLVPLYQNCQTFLEKFVNSAKIIIILPHTISGNENLLQSLPNNVFIFCRDHISWSYCRSLSKFPQNILFGHDLALQVVIPLINKPMYNDLYAFRNDKEINCNRKSIPSNNTDISLNYYVNVNSVDDTIRQAKEFLRIIDKYNIIHTDRLHVAIAGHILHKKVNFYNNSYSKNTSVHDSTLSKFPNIIYHENKFPIIL